MYTNLIAYRAAVQPHAPAIMGPTGEVSYEQFDREINRIAHALRDLLPARHSRIAILVDDLYLHWLLVLALGRLGHLSVSLESGDGNFVRYIAPDAVLTDRARTPQDTGKFVYLSDEWRLETLRSGNAAPVQAQVHPEDAARIIVSSGTTGRPKKVLFSHDLIARRTKTWLLAQYLGASGGSDRRFLATLGITTVAGFLGPVVTWSVGGVVLLGFSPKKDLKKLVSLRPSVVGLSPVQLKEWIEALPDGFTPFPNLTVMVAGGHLSQALSEKARLKLSPILFVTYGSTEAGGVAGGPVTLFDTQGGAAGLKYPWVDVEIVDEAGDVLPPGAVGEVRVRSEDIVTGYLEDDETSARAFRGGWFYPGDLGSLSETGVLKIVGRSAEVMNLGGQKVAPNDIEAVLAHCPGVIDLAAFSVPDHLGVEQPFVAVVQGEDFDQNTFRQICQKRLSRLPQIGIVRVTSVPRNQMGKVQRNVLRESVLKVLREKQPAA